MVQIGVWKGINLDGGGSTQLVSRPLGEFETQLINSPEFGSARPVVNGLGVYTNAPQGQLKDFLIRGSEELFIREREAYNLRGYDQFFNPLDMSAMAWKWSVSDPIGAFEGNVLVPSNSGKATITVSNDSISKKIDVNVIGRSDINALTIAASSGVLAEGATYTLPVTVELRDGSKRLVPAQSIDWEFLGFGGAFKDNVLTVEHLGNHGMGHLIARYDGFSTMTTFMQGKESHWADFETMVQPVSFSGYPAQVSGTVSTGTMNETMDPLNQSAILQYDVSDAAGTRAAYVRFNSPQLEGKPFEMKLNVYGDNSYNWLRAEFIDGEGQIARVDLSREINWNGWKRVRADLSKLKHPLQLRSIYVVNPEERQEEREVSGMIAIDDITFLYPNELPRIITPKIQLTLNSKELTVDGFKRELDQAPVIVNSTTLVPIRFIVDALGGYVDWNNTEKKATLYKNEHLIDLWVDQTDFTINGRRTTAAVPPTVINYRTMVPLRLISKNFGWKVEWDNMTKTITLQ
jgi:hypothetical protein